MSRSYTHVKLLEKDILELRQCGKTRREIAEHFGLTIIQVKNLINRYNRRHRDIEDGKPPKRRGRPRSRPETPQEVLQAENRRLRLENELLRSFLQAAGRR